MLVGIDQNEAAQGLKSGQGRFYTFTIDISQKGLAHIGGDRDKLRDQFWSAPQNGAKMKIES